MHFIYLLTPFAAWLVTGVLKFLINSVRSRELAFRHIGYGGMPSNHSAIISSAVTQVGIQEGIDSPAFGIGIAIAFIVVLDATSLRRQLGRHAVLINQLNEKSETRVRERLGHSAPEVLVGLLVGALVAAGLDWVLG